MRYLFLFCLAVASWSYSYFMWQIATDAVSALFWSRILMIGAIFTSIFYLHLVLVYLNLDKEKFYRTTLIIFYLFSFYLDSGRCHALFCGHSGAAFHF